MIPDRVLAVPRNRSVATLQMVGGHPALDFANTVANRGGTPGPDLLETYADLLEFGARANLAKSPALERLRRLSSDSPAEAQAALERAKLLREAIYRLCPTATPEPGAEVADLDLLAAATRRALADRSLRPAPAGYGWHWPEGDLDAIANRLAIGAADLLTSPSFGRVKACPGRNCGWLFLDTTRNGRRTWCSDRDCGTLARVARHRSKTSR